MKVSFKEWLRKEWLTKHKTSKQEISDLLSVVARDLEACQTAELVGDWRFNIAYNAALQLSKVALSASGYDAGRVGHHYRLIQSLQLTLEYSVETISLLDHARKKRNLSDYEKAGVITESEVEMIIELALNLHTDVRSWLKKNHPELI
jgi:hypothetical protein